MILSDFSVKHPSIITIFLVGLMVFGLLAFKSLNSEMIPPVSQPEASIVTIYPGAGAKEVERDISRLIENQMSTLPGVANLGSSSSDSTSVVSMEFRSYVNVREKLPQIRELLNGIIDELPDGIDGAPVIYITEASAFLPVLSVRISSDLETETLTEYLEERISPAIARIPGVSRINLVGGTKLEVRIILDIAALESRRLSALGVHEALDRKSVV